MPRPKIWAGPTGRDLVLDVNAALNAKGLSTTDRHAVRDAIAVLIRKPRWRPWSEETLRMKYYEARKHHGDRPKAAARSGVAARRLEDVPR
jgi:hypothetical protein